MVVGSKDKKAIGSWQHFADRRGGIVDHKGAIGVSIGTVFTSIGNCIDYSIFGIAFGWIRINETNCLHVRDFGLAQLCRCSIGNPIEIRLDLGGKVSLVIVYGGSSVVAIGHAGFQSKIGLAIGLVGIYDGGASVLHIDITQGRLLVSEFVV